MRVRASARAETKSRARSGLVIRPGPILKLGRMPGVLARAIATARVGNHRNHPCSPVQCPMQACPYRSIATARVLNCCGSCS